MKNLELPFKIGEQYEKWEFQLEPLEIERIKGFDSYKYNDAIEFLEINFKDVELVFCLDVLHAVILQTFISCIINLDALIPLLQNIENSISMYMKVDFDKLILEISYGKPYIFCKFPRREMLNE